MLVRKLDDYPATYDTRIELSKLFRFFPDMGFKRFRVGDIPCCNL